MAIIPPITSDQYHQDGTPGYAFVGSSDVVTIAAGVLVGSTGSSGVISNGGLNTDTLINNGNILSGRDGAGVIADGVFFQTSNGFITNNISGTIVAARNGITVEGDFESIVNHGTVFGLRIAGVRMGSESDHASLTNDGEIYGRQAGVDVVSGGDGFAALGGTIANTGSGLIRSDHDGIVVDPLTGLRTIVTNAAGATVRGGDYSIHAIRGAVQLTNDGHLFGTVQCVAADANDSITNRGTITGSVVLGFGNDVYHGGGTVTGSIQGNNGSDTFYASRAREVFSGGTGQDKFIFNATVFSPANASRDFIGDFKHSEADKIDVHLIDADLTHAGNQAFHFIGADSFAHYHATHASVVGILRFDPATDQLQGNVNANFSNAEFSVTLHGVAAMFGSDFIL